MHFAIIIVFFMIKPHPLNSNPGTFVIQGSNFLHDLKRLYARVDPCNTIYINDHVA